MTSVPDCFCSLNSLCFRGRCTVLPKPPMPHVFLYSYEFWSLKSRRAVLCEGVSQDGEPRRSAACDDLPGCTALAVTNAGNLWHLVADEEQKKKSEKKTRCSYFSLMMLLCTWRLRPKYLSHNSYLVLGRRHYCSAGGRVNAYLAHRESRVLLRDSSLWISKCHDAASHTVCWKLAAKVFHTWFWIYFHLVTAYMNSSTNHCKFEMEKAFLWHSLIHSGWAWP